MAELIEQLIVGKRDFGLAVCQRMRDCIIKLNFPSQIAISFPEYDTAEFGLITDTFTQTQDLVGYWYDCQGQRMGQLKFYSDDSFYAEYDVVQPHPGKKQYFVEAINAWGRLNNIKVEAKLLDVPQD